MTYWISFVHSSVLVPNLAITDGVQLQGGLYHSTVTAVFSSPEHKVLMVSYCSQSMSVVHRSSFVVRRPQLL